MEVAAISEQRCPFCRQNVAAGHGIKLSALFTERKQHIMEIIENHHPGRVPCRAVAETLYAYDPNGGPDDAEGVVRVHIHNINKRLKPHGWQVKGCIHGTYNGYGLVPLSPGQHNDVSLGKWPSVIFKGFQRRLVETLEQWHPDWVKTETIIDNLYVGGTKMPVDPWGEVHSKIYKINQRLSSHDWWIAGRPGGYRLERLEAVA